MNIFLKLKKHIASFLYNKTFYGRHYLDKKRDLCIFSQNCSPYYYKNKKNTFTIKRVICIFNGEVSLNKIKLLMEVYQSD